MLNEFNFEGVVKSEPILCSSKQTGNSFVKFTIRNDPKYTWYVIKKLKECNETNERRWGQVYIDCFAHLYKNGESPGKYVLENVHKYDTIKASGAIRSGRKPVKEEGDQFRANWVYGDYLYVNVKQIEVTKKGIQKKTSRYEDKKFFSDYPNFHNQIKSFDQYVTDDDLIFDI